MCQTSDCSMTTESMPITNIISQRTLQVFGYVARFPEAEPVQRVLSVSNNPEWPRPKRRPRGLWQEQTNASCRECLSIGREFA